MGGMEDEIVLLVGAGVSGYDLLPAADHHHAHTAAHQHLPLSVGHRYRGVAHGDALVNETPGYVSARVTEGTGDDGQGRVRHRVRPPSIASLFSNRPQGLRYSWAVVSMRPGKVSLTIASLSPLPASPPSATGCPKGETPEPEET